MAAADMMVTVAGAGDKSGSTWANAMGMAEWITDMTTNSEAGDRYFVEEGTYTFGGASDSSARNGTSAAPIQIIGVLSGTSNEPPVFSDYASGANRPVMAVAANVFSVGDYWIAQGLDTTTTNSNGFYVGDYSIVYNCKSNNSGIATRYAFRGDQATRFIACEAQSANGRAIRLHIATSCVACYAHDSVVGFYFGSAYSTVVNCIADTCTTYGLCVDNQSVQVMVNNTIYNCGTGIYGSTGFASTVINNIIDACTKGVEWTTPDLSSWFDYNCWDNTDDVVDTDIIWGNNRSEGDPGMAGPAGGDFTVTQADANVHNLALDVGDLTGATV